MSVVFVPQRLRSKCEINQATIQKLLDENNQLIQCIVEYQNNGKAAECTQYQQILHRNLIYLATIADSSQNVASAHPLVLNQPMAMGPGVMDPVGRAGDPMGSGTPPPGQGNPHQMAAGTPFPQAHCQQVAPGTSMGLPVVSHGNVGNFNQPAAPPQNMAAQEQMGVSMGSSLATHLQPGSHNPAPPQQQGSQGEFFNQQFTQSQAPADGMNLQLYPEGNNWFGPQQGQFQQNSSAHQQTFFQQFPNQQPLTSTPQEFNSAQNSQGQFRSFQQDPGQQYAAYRPQQPAVNAAQPQAFQYGQGAAFGGFQ
ncbi:calcium-responsive transactivator-like [Hypanus sabinus]|uniref:calcium-responsive transactivator-like n=1 Tax=Hypanus sabinus TaxID=79690 RepID=UPI0028C41A97|nr:calcium-responsive transactivator-like [Hypanus sabinus]